MQGLSDALADVGEGTVETPAEEYAMMLEVMMADRPGWPHPPTFSWNTGMVMHVLKSNLVLRDGPGTAYLFFYDKQGHQGLTQDTAHAIWTHVERLFQSGFHALPTLPLASFLWWRCGGKQLLPPTAEG